MRSPKDLVWRTLSAHALRSTLTTLAITLGVAMVVAASIIGQAANRSADELAAQRGIDLEILAEEGVPLANDVLDIVRGQPFVGQASPLLLLDVSATSPPVPTLTLVGIDPASYLALHELQLTSGNFLSGPDVVVLPVLMALEHGLAIGDAITVKQGQQLAVFTLGDQFRVDEGTGVASTPANHAFVSLPAAQELAGTPGRIDRIEVSLQPGVDVAAAERELESVIPTGFTVVPVAGENPAQGNVAFVQIALALVGSILLLVAGFVILNAFAMSITGRLRELGALRAMGMTQRQIRRMVLTEAAVLGGLGTFVGLPVGLALAWLTMQLLGSLAEVPFTVPWWGVFTGVALGMMITMFAALQPALRASRVPPILAVRAQTSEATENWYLRSGGRLGSALLLVLIFGFALFSLLATPSIPLALALMVLGQGGLLVAAILLLPGVVTVGAKLARPILVRWFLTPGRLAADNLMRNKLRTVLTAGALIAVFTMVIATSGFMAAGFKGAFNRLDSLVKEDAFISVDVVALVASGDLTFENFFQFISQADGSLDLNAPIHALQSLVDQGMIQVERNRFVPIPPEWSGLPGAPGNFVDLDIFLPIGSFDFFEGDAESALAMAADGPVVLLPPVASEQLGVNVGDALPMQTPAGRIEFTVAGIGGSGWNMTIFNYPDALTYFGARSPTHLGVVVSEGAEVDRALAEVDELLANYPDLALQFPYDSLTSLVDRLTLLLNGLLLLAVVVAALGIINTMVINVTERQREIGLLRAVGATTKQVRRMIVSEAVVLGLISAVVAALLGLLLLLIFALLVPHVTSSLGVRGNWETIQVLIRAGLRDWALATAVSLVWGPLVAAAAAYYPARQAAAVDVITATRGERISLKLSKAKRGGRGVRRRLT